MNSGYGSLKAKWWYASGMHRLDDCQGTTESYELLERHKKTLRIRVLHSWDSYGNLQDDNISYFNWYAFASKEDFLAFVTSDILKEVKEYIKKEDIVALISNVRPVVWTAYNFTRQLMTDIVANCHIWKWHHRSSLWSLPPVIVEILVFWENSGAEKGLLDFFSSLEAILVMLDRVDEIDRLSMRLRIPVSGL